MSGTNKKGDKASARHPDSLQLVRQWAMIQLLADATEPLSVKQLADQLATSKATVERDIATLEQTFALLEEPAGKQKKVYRSTRRCVRWRRSRSAPPSCSRSTPRSRR